MRLLLQDNPGLSTPLMPTKSEKAILFLSISPGRAFRLTQSGGAPDFSFLRLAIRHLSLTCERLELFGRRGV
jgi:hypothetical protein